MAKRYDNMTPEEQRAFDEIDLEILARLDSGETYAQITAATGVNQMRIAKVKRECLHITTK